jgi:branched-chain amino acid transport system ATP-binding protein
LHKRFGQVVVADGIDLTVSHGACLGIIGPNGAGKTTLFNLIDGTNAADAGRVLLEDVDITALPQHRRARLGISRAYQIPQPFPDLSLYENVLVAATFQAGLSGSAADKWAMAVLDETGLVDKRHVIAGGVPLLDRKRLELARALGGRPKVLMLDEIAGGLTEPEVRELVGIVLRLKADHAVIWIEHVAHALTAAADTLMVLHFGRKIAEGEPHTILRSPQVRDVYLGIGSDAAA